MSKNYLKKEEKTSPVDILSKMEHTIATVSELRTPIFAPIERISHNSILSQNFKKNKGVRAVSTAWGEIITRGRVLLGQQHRDLLDCIYINASHYQETNHGSMRIYFCQRKVLRHYSKGALNNHAWLRVKLEEIRDTAIQYKTLKGGASDFNIIKHLDYANDGSNYCIELDERYVKFYAQDLSVGYQKLLPKILCIKNSVIKSIVRFLLSHTHIKIGLDKALDAVGYPLCDISETKQRSFYKELRESKEYLKEAFHIDYSDSIKIFEYSKHEDVCFEWPLKQREKAMDSHNALHVEDLIGKSITRAFFEKDVLIRATLSKITQAQHLISPEAEKKFTVCLQFPDNRILEISEPFSSLEAIQAILD